MGLFMSNFPLKRHSWDFPSGPMIKTASTAGGAGSITGQGTKILHSSWCSPKLKKEQRHFTTQKKVMMRGDRYVN